MDFQENKLKTNIQIIVTLNKKVFMHIWIKKKKKDRQINKIAQQIKMLVTKPGDPSFVPRPAQSKTIIGSSKLASDCHMLTVAQHTHTLHACMCTYMLILMRGEKGG